MADPQHREKHLNYVGMQATRDVSRVFMWIKFAVGGLGLIYTIGFFFFSNKNVGSEAGAYVFISIIPLIILIWGFWDLFWITLSKLSERRMRYNDRRGHPNTWNLMAVTIGGFIFLHVVMTNFLGSGYLSVLLTAPTVDVNPFVYFAVFCPYFAFAALMLLFWLNPPDDDRQLSEEEEVALAEEKRSSQRLKIFGIYAVGIFGCFLIIYFGI